MTEVPADWFGLAEKAGKKTRGRARRGGRVTCVEGRTDFSGGADQFDGGLVCHPSS